MIDAKLNFERTIFHIVPIRIFRIFPNVIVTMWFFNHHFLFNIFYKYPTYNFRIQNVDRYIQITSNFKLTNKLTG